MFGKLLDTASLLKAKIARDELDQALIEATNDDNWQASTTVLHEIASSAYTHEKWRRISEFLWEKLKSSSRWKKVLKALNIVQFLLKNGPGYAVDELRRELHYFRTLESFQAYEDNMDRGAPIRERAKAVVALLSNEDLLEDERVRARQIRQRMSHLSGTANPPGHSKGSTGPKYESYNSETFGKGGSGDNNAFYNYGHGNYGDREYDRSHRDDYFQHAARKVESPKTEVKENPQQKETVVVKPKPIEPAATTNPAKGNYETMAQRLMRSKTTKVQQPKIDQTIPIVPDLSYKKKDVEDLLIDTQAHFIENRYHFNPPKPTTFSSPSAIQTHSQHIYSSVPAPTNGIITALGGSQNTAQPSNLLTETDGLLLLGIQPLQNVKEVESAKPLSEQTPTASQLSLINAPPINQPQLQSLPLYQSPQIQQQVQAPVTPQPPFQQISQPQIQAGYGYAQAAYSQGIQYPPQAYQPNYGGYYNTPITFYQQPPYNPYALNGFPVVPANNPYSAPYNPQPFYSNVPYQASSYQRTLPSYNPTPNTISFSTGVSSPSSPPPPPKKTEDQFGDFKNGGSFQIQKIGWLSNKEKNLTDLTDFTIDPKDLQKAEKKKEFGNKVKIDPWAW